ncbi:polysaccharide pyruvyl transferase family protein [Paramicrobacterium agarici]|uniref:Polysaccharide pyruvyl transferase WcaK-like protein n=1 Tax=Paramicrobacterium agarici TaxID=630514 RepID=A0A2A9DWD2_9MICO|nr:polysaccharide pyruvyl transferase family protein [Microbacterium agarici]PFG30676.1 polysaccharide pyruvyl transferase WcaK-like protein [Microbacterium agarici]
MRRINAVGYYGWDNFGDELFRIAVQRNRELIWGEGARVRSFVTPVRTLHQNLGVLGRVTRLVETLIGAVWADTVALCGGSVLEDVRGTQRLRGLILRRRTIEGLGVSLGPWESEAPRERVQAYLKRMERVVVRDQASSDRLGGSVPVGGDLAALYPMPRFSTGERKHLTICVSKDSRSTVDELVALLSALLRGIDLPVKLLALNVRRSHGDVEFSHEIRERLLPHHSDVEVVKFESIDQSIGIIAKSKAVWSQRLHGLIVAYLCDVPILALSHHQKISDFAAHIRLPTRFLRTDLTFDDEVRSAAAETLLANPKWEVTPQQYKDATIEAMRAS